MKSAFDKFTSEIGTKRTISAVSADFSAESVYNISHDIEKYFNGLGDGVSFVSLYLKNRAMICPDERIVLAGYSQGAMVMHRVAQQLYKLRNSTDSSPRNNKTILSRIDAIILIGDGDRVPNDNAQYYGNMRQRSSGVGLGFWGTATIWYFNR
ncbi:cutinase family protein [bacterium]|nr:MAG: cutinase family protein [bacterium]